MNIKKAAAVFLAVFCLPIAAYADLTVKENGSTEAVVIFDGRQGADFDDVSSEDWFFDDVDFVFKNKIMSGTSDNMFSPEAFVTRAMAITVLYRMSGEPDFSGKASQFGDVGSDCYYASAVGWGAESKIVSGTGGGKFSPDEPLTREQLAVMLFNLSGGNEEDTSELAEYADFSAVSDWAVAALGWSVKKGLIGGREGRLLAPTDFVTRAETAAVVGRYLRLN